jgi:hypothetical protein
LAMQSQWLPSHPSQFDWRRKIVAARRCGPGPLAVQSPS